MPVKRVGSVCLKAAQRQPDTPTSDFAGYYQLASQVPIDMSLPGEPARPLAQIRYAARHRSPRRLMVRAAAFSIVLVVLVGGLLAAQNYLKLQKVFRGGGNQAVALNAYVNPNLLKGESSGRVNLLILGEDGPGHSNSSVTNSLTFASIDTVNHQATLLSLPANLWVTVPEQGVMPLKQAWQSVLTRYGAVKNPSALSSQVLKSAFEVTDQTVEDVTGQPVDYNLIVNYKALSQAVDTVGGINLNVPTTLNDPSMAWQNGGNPVLANSGAQVLNGAQTLNYVSSKETTSDFDRASRQRAVLVALMNKIVSLGTLSDPLKLTSLLSTFGNNVATDLSINNGVRLYGLISDIDPTTITSLSLGGNSAPGSVNYVTNGIVDGQPVLLPASGLFNYQAIQNYLASQLKNPYLIKENAKILVLNGTDTPGLATEVANQLKSSGYNILEAGNTPSGGWTTTSLIDLTKDHNLTKQALEKRFHVKAANRLSDTSIPTDGADFVIIIGSNETHPT